ncbi:hypothetical protein HYPSUDRAFT_412380 [Hypholoma sublateritium FD-334 SS-4]|uniref:Calpain catalytic domain-containing protein n=1 Tax=Hypholoma sublateritium (strain FD-334 SS-4) TaxID=945553 RepID=A0A0D2N738_HYPSF|nr:hypothetical protein HYPSUDRAFT_412380 [Hypholoma sublateritium FD-334 SS-4]
MRIAKECRTRNTKFRDIEFDLENDGTRCQHGLYSDGSKIPPDVRRVTEIFENPQFFKGGPNSNDIIQGALGDCWFLSALSTLTTAPELLQKLCIARDEEVGIYGFIFFRDSHWVNVIIDDQIFCNTPKFEELKKEEQELYHDDKEMYNNLTRQGGKGLVYAKSGSSGETWVPLFEKAYAKLHGDYLSLTGGTSSEGIEDLTGGISVNTKICDILDTDQFWREELMQLNNKTHLFGVSFQGLDKERSGTTATVQGLYGSHAYSVLRVKECRGKRFLVIRNPWGKSEWTGPWSDGSKEWNGDWIQVLQELDHVLGDDGEFVMEYADFLKTWQVVQRTRIFDSTWVMSSHWLSVPPPPLIHPWTHGKVSFHFTLPKASPVIVVLSQLDSRFFKFVDGVTSLSNIDFCVYKIDESDVKGTSQSPTFCQRSVSCELDLQAGNYVVYPRIDLVNVDERGYFDEGFKLWGKRKLSRVLAERTKGRAIASNYELGIRKKFIPVSISDLIELESSATESDFPENQTVTTIVNEHKKPSMEVSAANEAAGSITRSTPTGNLNSGAACSTGSADTMASDNEKKSEKVKLEVTGDDEDEPSITLGLKVYTKRDSVVVITGKLPSDKTVSPT